MKQRLDRLGGHPVGDQAHHLLRQLGTQRLEQEDAVGARPVARPAKDGGQGVQEVGLPSQDLRQAPLRWFERVENGGEEEQLGERGEERMEVGEARGGGGGAAGGGVAVAEGDLGIGMKK